MESRPSRDYEDPGQEQLNAVMPWVGLYITAASAVCTLAMAADAFNGFRRKKLWFPCKYFSLNATSLTVLAVAMKLPMDLTTMLFHTYIDGVAKCMSLIFISTVMANFMSSLGSMTDKELLANNVALGILVITITGNMVIQLIQLQLTTYFSIIFLWVPAMLMLFLLATLLSMAITVPSMKRRLESIYQEKHKLAFREEEVLKRRDALTIDKQRGEMMKYWVMAETSSPQFVMARSVISTTSAVISLLAAIILASAHILRIVGIARDKGKSPYKDYTKWILYVQSIGVVVGTIAPVMRWFLSISFKCSTTKWNSFKKGFKIEAYWIQTLVDRRDSFSILQIRHNRCRRYLHDVKWFALTFCIGIHILIVLISKLLVFLSCLLVSPFFFCFTHLKNFVKQTGHETGGDRELNLSRYVLRLEGEPELPRRIIKNICCEADNIINTGRKKQPQNLASLLKKFVNFNGVGQFDSDQISSLHSQEPPNCWTLPIVTLTSIAVALPNIAKHKSKELLSSVGEGLSLSNIVEKTLVQNAELISIRKAADICWVEVVLYMKWLDVDLRRMSLKCENSKSVLEKLSKKAKEIIAEFKKEEQDPAMENPLNWPAKVVSANSMYRISRTILLSCEEENEHTDEELFEQLSVMIADILAACSTNLARVITLMCHRNAIEKREKCVRKAFLLLGKTEEVLKILQQQEWPSLDHDKAACIEEWRALFRQDKDHDPTAMTSSSNDQMVATPFSGEHFAIAVDS